jgi:hypothetical protein
MSQFQILVTTTMTPNGGQVAVHTITVAFDDPLVAIAAVTKINNCDRGRSVLQQQAMCLFTYTAP